MRRRRGSPARVSGRDIGRVRKFCWECGNCGVWFDDVKPKRCPSCQAETILTFDSVGERSRWAELKLLQKAGKINRLRRQVRMSLDVNGVRLGVLVLDFDYFDDHNKYVAEDFKGGITDLFRWKAKHFEAQYRVPIRITT